ncbi:MAG: hypothetical protein ABI946_00450 [Chthoniobacterales bacterium]
MNSTLSNPTENETASSGARPAAALLPYPGLRPFEEEDRAVFFGREAQIVSVLSLLAEQQFIAIVGSSGSGKSSLIRAGVIPAVREGFLEATTDWKIIVLKPGSDPYGNLARELMGGGVKRSAPAFHSLTSETVKTDSAENLAEQLLCADRSLVDLFSPASGGVNLLGAQAPRVLLVVDQFEELFTFRRAENALGAETARFASRDHAAAFVQLLLRCASEPDGPIKVVITMRSDFIGDCDAFLDLPEAVSRSQFLVPRLNGSQMREAIERPGQALGLGFAPFTFEDGLANRIIADAGDRVDQLPLMQHCLMRTWKLAGGPSMPLDSNLTLTQKHYETAGGITGALSKHANEAWTAIKENEQKAGLARRLFLLLSDVQPDGKITRRRPLLSEVQEVTGGSVAEIEEIVRLFQSDDRNFLLPPLRADEHLKAEDRLDISHEALLRQWNVFGGWLTREIDSNAWLQELSKAAQDFERDPSTELWHGNDLRGGEEWMRKETPTFAWAKRHGVHNWEQCLAFLERSHEAERVFQEEKKRLAQEALKEKERRQKNWLTAIGVIAAACLIAGLVMASLWNSASRSEARGKEVIDAFVVTATKLRPPVLSYARSAFSEEEQQTAKLTAALAKGEAADPAVIKELLRARGAADGGVAAIDDLVKSIGEAAAVMKDERLTFAMAELAIDALEFRNRRAALQKNPEVFAAIHSSIEARLTLAERSLSGLVNTRPLDPALLAAKNKEDIPAATANLAAAEATGEAAKALGFPTQDLRDFEQRGQAVADTLATIQGLNVAGAPQLETWHQTAAVALRHLGKVNRVRFAPTGAAVGPLMAAACDDGSVYFWKPDGTSWGKIPIGKSAVNDLAFSPGGDALAAASNGSTVRIFRSAGPLNLSIIKATAFELHADSITDVEWSHGGERIASASADRTVRVFDSHSLAQKYFTSPPLPGIITSVEFHRGDNLVVSGCDDGGVRLHTIDQPAVQLLGKFDAPARRPEFSPDGKLVIAASGDKTARVWTINEPHEVVNIQHPAPVTQATFRHGSDPVGYTFVTCATNGEVRSVHIIPGPGDSTSPEIELLEPRHPGAVLSAAWSPDDRWLATVGGGEVLIWNLQGAHPVARLRLTMLHAATSRAVFSPDSKLLVTYGGDEFALVWDLTKLKQQ